MKTWKKPLVVGLVTLNFISSSFAEIMTHRDGDLYIAGDFQFNEIGTAANYEGLKPSEYGYFFLEDIMNMETMQPFSIKTRELQYFISSDDDVTKKSKSVGIGIRPIPVVNGNYKDLANAQTAFTAQNAQGESQEIRGSELMDAHLRKAFGYKGQDLVDGPIFSYMSYMHPEKSKTRLKFSEIGNPSNLKSENGITHLGAYIGNGDTRNSPYDYHRMTWGHKSGRLTYPVNMYVITYKGAKSQKVFNTNGIIALRTLNELNGGPVFPPDYKFDKFKTISLEKNLDFYRAWIDTSWKKNPNDTQSVYEMMTSSQAEWDTYCAEHLTIALNIAVNVEHNEEGFKRIWGEVEGADLWQKLQDRWANDLNASFTPIADADFESLWEIDKVKNPTAKSGVGKAMVWKPETTANLVSDFVQQYVPFYKVGAINTSLVIFGFAKEFQKRMGMDPVSFGNLTVPVLAKMFKHEIAIKTAAGIEAKLKAMGQSVDILRTTDPTMKALIDAAIKQQQATLEAEVVGATQKYAAGLDQLAQMKPELAAAVPALKGALNMISANPAEVQDVVKKGLAYVTIPAERRGIKANDDFLVEARSAFEKAVNANVKEEDGVYRVKYYSPPAILRRIYLGLHKAHNTIKVYPVATAVRASDVEPKPSAQPVPAVTPEQPADDAL